MAPQTKTVFGQPEKKSPVKLLGGIALISLILAAITWMIATNPAQKSLNCNTDVMPALTYFGTCTED